MTRDTATSTSFNLKLDIEGQPYPLAMEVPNQALNLLEFLPLVWKLQEALLGVWLEAERGNAVSCRAGCGACCRQLVPVSVMEAEHLRQLVEQLPEDRRQSLRQRFATALDALAERGLLEPIKKLPELGLEDKRQLGHDYFAAGIACPFLEEESCSIHAMRPSACREYLVTSDPTHCATLDGKGIAMLDHGLKFSSILLGFTDDEGDDQPAIVPLVLALNMTVDDPGIWERRFAAPTLFQHFLNRLARQLSPA